MALEVKVAYTYITLIVHTFVNPFDHLPRIKYA